MAASTALTWLYWMAAALAAIVIIFLWIVAAKGRRLPGEHVFRASRWSRGNHLLPAQVAITPESITLYQPQWIGKLEESIHLAHVASIKIDTHLVFSDVFIETSGGRDPIICHGHTKGEALAMKNIIESYQSRHYQAEAGGPSTAQA
ncbi:MAG TPA: hypothetical protein VG538_17965 [Vicinamibacterales bacterium]|nr:hypothetical protein [Vicinamibacterales bacterium]